MRRFITAVVIYGAIFGVFIWLKREWSFTAPTIWADDGMFLTASFKGFWGSLVTPYAGYFHVYPRLVSGFITHCIPMAYWAVAVIILSFCAHIAMAADVAISKMQDGRVTAFFSGLCLLLLPHSGEVYANLANLQWPLTIWVFNTLFLRNREISIYRKFLVCSAALSSPFSAILLATYILFHKNRTTFFVSIVISVVILQVFLPLFVPSGSSVSLASNFENILIIFEHAASGAVGGHWATAWLILIALLLIKLMKDSRRNVIMVSIFFFYVAAIAFRMKGNSGIIDAHGPGARYFFPLYGMIFLTLINAYRGKAQMAVAFLCFLVPIQKNFMSRQDFPPLLPWSTLVIRKPAPTCLIPILPPGWNFQLCE